MENRESRVLYLSASTLDNIIRMKGTFPIEGGITRIVSNNQLEPGGESNSIILLKRLGGHPLPAGPMGDDVYCRYFLDVYKELDIDTKYLFHDESYHLPLVNAICDDCGVHTFISSFPDIHPEAYGFVKDCVKEADGYFMSGYYLAGGDPLEQIVIDVMHMAKGSGIPVFFDPGPCIRTARKDRIEDVLENVSVISLNETECEDLTGVPDVEEAAEQLCRRTCALILAKAGSRGCYAVSRNMNGKWYRPFNVRTVDTSGCGDSFLAGFMYCYLQNFDTDTCITVANACGAVKAGKPGTGRNVPEFNEVVNILEENGYTVNTESKMIGRFTGLSLRK